MNFQLDLRYVLDLAQIVKKNLEPCTFCFRYWPNNLLIIRESVTVN